MRNKAVDVRNYTFTKTDAILPDANIWLYLCGPASLPNDWAVQAYTSVLSRILKADSQLFLDVLVLSEFINRFARLEMKRLQPSRTDFKAFRRSAVFPNVATAIGVQVDLILTICKPIDHPFSEWNHTDLLKDFVTGTVDYNDQLIAENCRKHGFAALTNDRDFTEGGISVLTANNRLLAACP